MVIAIEISLRCLAAIYSCPSASERIFSGVVS